MSDAPAVRTRAQELLSVVEVVTGFGCRLDGVRLAATRQLTERLGVLALLDQGKSDPDELSKTARAQLVATARRLTRHEIEAATGWGAGDVTTLVAMANAPAAVRGPVHQGLARGEASWPLVRSFYRAASGLDHEDSAAIAHGLFGDDPQSAVTERTTRQGEFTGDPWRAKEFYRALDREVHKVKNRDPEAARKTRDRARHAADVRVRIDGDGTAEVLIGTRAAHAAAVADRIERAARGARKAGDKRTLRELRAAVAMSLLLHGTLDFSGIGDDQATLTVEQSDQLTKLMYALPTADLQVILPLEALFGSFTPNASPDDTGHSPGCRPGTGGDRPGPGDGTADPPGDGHDPNDRHDPTDGHDPSDGRDPSDGHDPNDHDLNDHDPSGAGHDPSAVGEVIGRHPCFLDSRQLWELLLTPGSSLYRLLTDPVTGRCVEKSAKGYRFTAAQRAQIVAADVFCRAAGCLVPAWLCQIDHVQEYGTAGGDTSEANAQSAHDPHHDLKTKKAWDATINAQREVTWTTLLRRIYTTKAHDHTQYTKLLTAATGFVTAAEGPDISTGLTQLTGAAEPANPADPASPADENVADRAEGRVVPVQEATSDGADRLDLAVYQALSYLPPGAPLERPADWDDSDDVFHGWELITLTHRDANGRRVWRPDPATVQAARRAHHDSGEDATTTGTASGRACTDTKGDQADGDHALLEGIDLSQSIDLTTLDPATPAQDDTHGTTTDPFGPVRYSHWSLHDDDPPF
ncbi:hypothetical protein MWU75_01845 [Ornithinimicrobium sp. F0845]|uniref:hypothetical protein n=1 Tax=Ornithinimicrobium sp. F0845 TaxID=2926412 RepID=UPI001FF43F12|nr:hypothetical protein [Ornithinimicrobium sp. F0845]MCK0110886.1 hypothetical protein [Ornithinimicrobium sp. F0845]